MAVVYRCDVCRKETHAFRSLTFKRSVIANGQVAAPEAIMSLDVCSDACELQAATRLLQKLSRASSVDEQGRPVPRSSIDTDPGPTQNAPSWESFSPHRRP